MTSLSHLLTVREILFVEKLETPGRCNRALDLIRYCFAAGPDAARALKITRMRQAELLGMSHPELA